MVSANHRDIPEEREPFIVPSGYDTNIGRITEGNLGELPGKHRMETLVYFLEECLVVFLQEYLVELLEESLVQLKVKSLCEWM